MNVWPLRFRELTSENTIFSDDAGGFFRSDRRFLQRYAEADLTPDDAVFLKDGGHAFDREFDLSFTSFAYRWARRQSVQQKLNYVILIPTLRCNLTCGYCQVSRVAEKAKGFDWTEETLQQVLLFLKRIDGDELKIEFQGGEPLLRLDILNVVRDFARARFKRVQFVVCTNLQRLEAEHWSFFEAADTFISTSLDGDPSTHERQRTHEAGATQAFFANLDEAVRRLGPGKVSALPTINIDQPPGIESLIKAFESRGIRSIYLRPINHQGFARKIKASEDHALERWNAFHSEFLEHLIQRNFGQPDVIEEYYFTQLLKRVLQSGMDNHVDIRNPNFFAADYLVVDFDGQLYPTDEARMQSRVGRIDLSIGHVTTGLDEEKVALLNGAAMNNFDADCIHCAYQPFCGTDVIDDLSRYGRIDVPRRETWFCRRHIALFDKVFELLYRDDQATRYSLSRWLGLGDWPEGIVRSHR